MYGVWTACLLSSAVAPLAADRVGDGCWRIDKSTVHVGGCVTIVIDKPCNESWDLALQIDDGKRVGLFDGVGPDYHRRASRFSEEEATLVLVYQQLWNSDAFEPIPELPGKFRAIPVFNKPGSVRLTLYAGDVSLGTRSVTVISCPPEARSSLGLLFPPVPGERGGSRDAYLWSSLMIEPTFAPPLTEREVRKLRHELPVMKHHPDWAEIAEMRLACIEAWHYLSEISEEGMSRLRDDVETPELPELVLECRVRKVADAFARAVQDDLGARCATLTYLLHHRERERDANREP